MRVLGPTSPARSIMAWCPQQHFRDPCVNSEILRSHPSDAQFEATKYRILVMPWLHRPSAASIVSRSAPEVASRTKKHVSISHVQQPAPCVTLCRALLQNLRVMNGSFCPPSPLVPCTSTLHMQKNIPLELVRKNYIYSYIKD